MHKKWMRFWKSISSVFKFVFNYEDLNFIEINMFFHFQVQSLDTCKSHDIVKIIHTKQLLFFKCKKSAKVYVKFE